MDGRGTVSGERASHAFIPPSQPFRKPHSSYLNIAFVLNRSTLYKRLGDIEEHSMLVIKVKLSIQLNLPLH